MKTPQRVTEVATGIYRLSLLPGDRLNAYAVVQDRAVTLIDSGLPWVSAPVLLRCLDRLGIRQSQVTQLIATHAHLDHVGGLARLQSRLHATTLAHADEANYIRSGQTPAFDCATPAGRWADRLVRFGFPRAKVDVILTDRQVVEAGLEVVHTPGHTPGHVCLRHPDTGVLFVGDALYHFGERLSWPNYATCWNFAMAQTSARSLAGLDFSTACFGHGPQLTVDALAAISEFVSP